jgi:TetR/AcrR family transcriptional repressor of nem operon
MHKMPRVKLFSEEEALEKAMMIFWKKGYHDTSIQYMVDHLGINRASLYDTFGGKKKLFDSAFEHYRKTGNEGFRELLNAQEGVKETLRMIFRKVIEEDVSDPDNKGCLVANTTTELLPHDLELQLVITRHREDVEQIIYNFLLKGVQSGEISGEKDLKTMASLLYTLLTGLRVTGKTRPDQKESMASVDAVLSLLD